MPAFQPHVIKVFHYLEEGTLDKCPMRQEPHNKFKILFTFISFCVLSNVLSVL